MMSVPELCSAPGPELTPERMPDIMLDRMANRISEYMSDRMMADGKPRMLALDGKPRNRRATVQKLIKRNMTENI